MVLIYRLKQKLKERVKRSDGVLMEFINVIRDNHGTNKPRYLNHIAQAKYKMLTNKEILILKQLRKDCRINLKELREVIGLSTATILHKIGKLERTVIKRHTILLDNKQIGYPIRNNFILRAKDQNNTKQFLMDHFNVNSISMTEDNEFYVDCFFKDLKEMYSFVNQLEEKDIEIKHTVHVIEGVKEEGLRFP